MDTGFEFVHVGHNRLLTLSRPVPRLGHNVENLDTALPGPGWEFEILEGQKDRYLNHPVDPPHDSKFSVCGLEKWIDLG